MNNSEFDHQTYNIPFCKADMMTCTRNIHVTFYQIVYRALFKDCLTDINAPIQADGLQSPVLKMVSLKNLVN